MANLTRPPRRWTLLHLTILLCAICLQSSSVAASSNHDLNARGHRHGVDVREAAAVAGSTVTETRTTTAATPGVTTSTSTGPGGEGGNTIVIMISTAGPASPSSTTTLPLSGNASLASGSIGSAFLNASSTANISSLSTSSASSLSLPTTPPVTMTITPTITVGPSSSASAGASNSSDKDQSSSTIAGLSPGGFAGLIVGIVVGLIALSILAYFLWKWLADARGRKEWERYQNLGPDTGAYMMGGAGGRGGRPPTEYAESLASESRRGTVDWRPRDSAPMMTFTGAGRPSSYAGSEAAGHGGYHRQSYRSDRSDRWQRGEY